MFAFSSTAMRYTDYESSRIETPVVHRASSASMQLGAIIDEIANEIGEDIYVVVEELVESVDMTDVNEDKPGATLQARELMRPETMTTQCPICLGDEAEDAFRLPCGHAFHAKCIDPWLKHNDVCPLCRDSLNARTMQE